MIRRHIVRIVTAAIIVAMLAAGCRRAEDAAEGMAQAASVNANAAVVARDEQELRTAFMKFRQVAEKADTLTISRIAHELDPDYQVVAQRTQERVAKYPVRQSVPVTLNGISSLVEVLTARETYFPPGDGWTCIFQPHHVLLARAKNEAVAIVICLECGDVEFSIGDDSAGTYSVLPRANAQLSALIGKLIE